MLYTLIAVLQISSGSLKMPDMKLQYMTNIV